MDRQEKQRQPDIAEAALRILAYLGENLVDLDPEAAKILRDYLTDLYIENEVCACHDKAITECTGMSIERFAQVIDKMISE